MQLIENFIRNYKEIVNFCNQNPDKFNSRRGENVLGHTGPLGADSKFSTWRHSDMPLNFINFIFSDSDFEEDVKDFFSFIQIQKYEPGDFIVPHKDNYDLKKLNLVSLTSSECDGLILQENMELYKIYDKAGQKIEADFNDFHWVDPVKTLRYSLVVGE